MPSKTCKKCGELRLFAEFHKDKHQSDGLTTQCKSCRRIKALEWRNANIDQARKNCREWEKKNQLHVATRMRQYRAEFPSRTRATSSRSYQKHRIKRLHQRREYVFGVTATEYQEMLDIQEGRCAICGDKEKSRTNGGRDDRAFFIDHDHTTGLIRGLLCHFCNAGLGFFRDRVDILDSAIDYLLCYSEASQ